MVMLAMRVLIFTHDTQGLGDSAFARREDGAHKSDVHVLEARRGEQRRTCYDQGHTCAGHAQLL